MLHGEGGGGGPGRLPHRMSWQYSSRPAKAAASQPGSSSQGGMSGRSPATILAPICGNDATSPCHHGGTPQVEAARLRDPAAAAPGRCLPTHGPATMRLPAQQRDFELMGGARFPTLKAGHAQHTLPQAALTTGVNPALLAHAHARSPASSLA